jgi:hypothetical protein
MPTEKTPPRPEVSTREEIARLLEEYGRACARRGSIPAWRMSFDPGTATERGALLASVDRLFAALKLAETCAEAEGRVADEALRERDEARAERDRAVAERDEANEHAARVERLGQKAVDNARDRAVAAEAERDRAVTDAAGWKRALVEKTDRLGTAEVRADKAEAALATEVDRRMAAQP